jgi:thioredoxin 1
MPPGPGHRRDRHTPEPNRDPSADSIESEPIDVHSRPRPSSSHFEHPPRQSTRQSTDSPTSDHRPETTQESHRVSGPNIVHTTDATFDRDVLKSDKPVLLDFWAEWCGPCKMIAPILDDIAKEYGERVKIAKLNIDENPATPPKYGIRGIPTLILFKNGTVEAQKVGAVTKSQLAAFLDSKL